MKESIFIEFNGEKVEQKQLIELAKNTWRDKGNKIKDIKSLDIYYKPEERACYYVINSDFSGNFNI